MGRFLRRLLEYAAIIFLASKIFSGYMEEARPYDTAGADASVKEHAYSGLKGMLIHKIAFTAHVSEAEAAEMYPAEVAEFKENFPRACKEIGEEILEDMHVTRTVNLVRKSIRKEFALDVKILEDGTQVFPEGYMAEHPKDTTTLVYRFGKTMPVHASMEEELVLR